MPRRHWVWHLTCVAGCLGSTARAEDAVPLPPVVVPLPPSEAPEAPTRRDPSGSITLIETDQHRGEAKDVAEMLAPAPGVLIQELGGLGQTKTLAVRGAASNGVLVLLDGIPLNGSGGNTDLSRIPAAMVERFEVLRGAAGARYGSGGLGGVINVVTLQPRAEDRISAEATEGSFHTTLAQVSASGSIADSPALLLIHGAHTAGDFTYLYNDRPELPGNPSVERTRENNRATLGGTLLKFHHGFSRRLSLDLLGEFSLESRGLAGTIDNPTPDASQSSQRVSTAIRATEALSESSEISGRAFFRRDWLQLKGGYFAAGLDEVDSVLGIELTASSLLGERHLLSATWLVEDDSLRQTSSISPSWARVGLMAADEMLFWEGLLSLNPSVRLDWTGPFFGVSPKLGLSLRLPAGFEFRANAGRAYRAPSFVELYQAQGAVLPNPDLKPERAWAGDGALLHRGSFSLVSVGGFYSIYDDLISYEYYPPLLSKPYNFSEVRVYGLEVEGDVRPHRWWSGSIGYTLLYSENRRDDPRFYLKDLPYRPRHRLYARLTVGPKLAHVRAELNYQSQQFVNRTATLAIPSRALVNLGLGCQPFSAPEVLISIEVKNVTNVLTQDLVGYPLPSRGVYLTASIVFERKRESAGASSNFNKGG